MKKLIAGLMSAALALGCVALPAEVAEKLDSVITASAATYGDFEYTVLDDGTVEITDYTGSGSKLAIPGTIDGKKVTSIGYHAFYYCTSLTSITIPNGVTSFSSGAFNSCTSLTSITIPNSVTSIGDGAFGNCTSLTSITIPNSVTSIGEDAFYGTPWLKAQQEKNPLVIINGILIDGTAASGNVVIPNSVTSIGYGAFYECTSLTSVTIPNSVTSIGDFAFYNCTSLASVTIPNSVISIGESAFDTCESLTSITIPNSVTSIGDGAFDHCTSLTSITIPNSVTSIGDYAFYKCTSLTSITIPNSVTSIGRSAFDYCTSLTDVYYTGSETEWSKININSYNNRLTDATIHYNYVPAVTVPDAKISQTYTSTGTSFTLKWGKVQGATGYKVYKYNGSTGKWVLVKTVSGANTLSTTVSGITPGSVIKFKVNAYLTKGTKTYYGKTNDSLYAAALAPASIKSSYTATTTTAAVSWNKVSGATGYKIYKYDSATKKWVLAKTVTSASTTSATVTGLTSKTTTKLKVNAYLTKGTKTYYGKAGTTLTIAAK